MENVPLAERLRPKTLDEYIGQKHLVGANAVLRNMIESDNISSFILWGPLGVGKTTLAQIIVNSGVKDIREVIESAKKQKFFSTPSPILFIDEIHRFSKSQQDSLLGAVEKGIVVLIGATTENPSFEVITPLLSRSQVYILKSLDKEDLETLLNRAITEDVILQTKQFDIRSTTALFRFSGGDARKLLNIIDLIVKASPNPETIIIDNETVTSLLQENTAIYDKNGEQHYDIISAFIKSVRGSDPNAAVYWLARMLEGGEDIMFIARRLLILASEDVGLANPNALLLANACFDAVNKIGMPEARIILSETTVYLATSPKSNSSYQAIDQATAAVKQTGDLPVPLHLRNAPTKLMKELGYGDNYKYAHSYQGNFVDLEFLPDGIVGTKFYLPSANNPKEAEILKRLQNIWKKYDY